ncbi:hypothetical protein [Sciscionella sediminilitoris]|uniref:hypothetical protein n=1 Tax=Sciscionella sediminilitoris TaxID=1445613 RepID=UPI0004DEFC24|nr:hypothetical protein [Sciscionella sp. SE31]
MTTKPASLFLAEVLVVAVAFLGLMSAREPWQTLLAAAVFLLGTVAVIAVHIRSRGNRSA